MIKVGCANAHPEDVSFLLSGEVSALLQSKDFLIDPVSVPPDEPSVDVLFVDVNKVNKLTAVTDLRSRVWVLLSSNKADAWRAWDLGASYFLLRPLSVPCLAQALERVEQSFYWKKQIPPPQSYQRMLELQMTKGRRLTVHSRDILFLEAQGEITCVHLGIPGHEKLIATRHLGYWEQQLDDAEFVRTHKKYLVNIAHVSAMNADEITVQHHVLPVAKRRRKEVEKSVYSHQILHNPPNTSLGA